MARTFHFSIISRLLPFPFPINSHFHLIFLLSLSLTSTSSQLQSIFFTPYLSLSYLTLSACCFPCLYHLLASLPSRLIVLMSSSLSPLLSLLSFSRYARHVNSTSGVTMLRVYLFIYLSIYLRIYSFKKFSNRVLYPSYQITKSRIFLLRLLTDSRIAIFFPDPNKLPFSFLTISQTAFLTNLQIAFLLL